MANKKKKENDSSLPLTVHENDTEKSSSITYASDVVAIIAGLAASEVEGIAGMVNVNGGLLGKNRNITRGIKVEVGTEEVSVDIYVNVEYGTPIQRAAHDAQESVKRSIESMTGLHVVRVDVHVMGVSFEKEMNALQAGAGNAALESGRTAAAIEEKKPDPAPAKEQAPEAPAEEKKEEAPAEPAPAEKAAAEEAPAEEAPAADEAAASGDAAPEEAPAADGEEQKCP